MQSVFDKKYFKQAGITQTMFNNQQISDIEQIALELYPMNAHKVKQLVSVVKNNPVSIYESWVKYQELSTKGVDLKLQSSLVYIYGEQLGKSIHYHRGVFASNQKRKVSSYEEGYVNSIPLLKERNISWASLTQLQKDRTCALLKYVHRKKHYYLKTTLSWFIIQDLTNYVGRYKRIQLAGQTSLYSYVLRYGASYGRELYHIACERKTAHFTNKLGFWVAQGLSVPEAEHQVWLIQKDRNQRSIELTTGTSEYSVRSLAYWLKKGYTQSQAAQKVSRVQSRVRTPAIVQQWLKTLANKNSHEKSLINLKRSHTIEGIMARGYNHEQATAMSIAYFAKRKNYSLISQKMFDMIKDRIGETGLYYKSLNYERQFGRSCVDFFDAYSGVVIEFLGDYWHANPYIYNRSDKIYNKPVSFVWLDDKKRFQALNSYKDVSYVYIVWESEFRDNPTETVAYAVDCINQHRKDK